MQSYGLNTVRIPVGHWIMEDSVNDGEYFPQGGLSALLDACEWASSRGFYIIIDLHGAPGAQVASNADTGHSASSAGFFTTANYDRAVEFLVWLRNKIRSEKAMRNVGSIGVLNEPNKVDSMRSDFYKRAYQKIRDVESGLKVADNNAVHVQFMNTLWGSGNPDEYLPSGAFSVAYEDHRYTKWDTSVTVTHDAYIKDACTNNRNPNGESPTIVTEWSHSPPDDVESTAEWSASSQTAFYAKWFAAQARKYESSTNGWIFWTWKTQLGDYRWSYKDAVAAGVIPTKLASLPSSTVCNAYS
ncbi:glycoside hydrolase superfamily [Xylariales sp. AK1849]|nr:glycoside hydrolase superfamily [Xylariales sp. AK1849]